jgi:hypothetical protein
MKSGRISGIALLLLFLHSVLAMSQQPFAPGTWKRINHAPRVPVGHTMLLTDGSVLALGSTCNRTGVWFRLVPDDTGSYVNGTWVMAGTLPEGYNPLYFASQLLPSGVVVIMGGEYNSCGFAWTTLGALYHPLTSKWTPLDAPVGWATIGDASSILLPNGKMMLANCCTSEEAILTLNNGVASWVPTGKGKEDSNDEEGWTMLPGNKILTVNAYTSGGCCAMGFQIYDPATGQWTTPVGKTVVNLVDSATSELGPMALLPNGSVFAAGGSTNNAVYTVATGKWAKAPSFGSGLDVADGPAAVLPDGNLLLDASPGVFNKGSVFFEWDGRILHHITAPSNAPADPSYAGNMLVLPTGEILFSDSSDIVEVYRSPGSPCAGCAPTVTSVASPLTRGSLNNVIRGTQFTGVTQGSYYGDDAQSFTNYPLIRITDSDKHVVYCGSHNWVPGVATGNKIVSAQFDIPSSIARGQATLEVVVNGIASEAVAVTID